MIVGWLMEGNRVQRNSSASRDRAAPSDGRTGFTGLDVSGLPGGGAVELSDFGALGATALVAWLVPGLILSLRALLILIIVLFQVGLATAFVPITRRLLGGRDVEAARRRRGTPVVPRSTS